MSIYEVQNLRQRVLAQVEVCSCRRKGIRKYSTKGLGYWFTGVSIFQ
jgi:hypothetical protein